MFVFSLTLIFSACSAVILLILLLSLSIYLFTWQNDLKDQNLYPNVGMKTISYKAIKKLSTPKTERLAK